MRKSFIPQVIIDNGCATPLEPDTEATLEKAEEHERKCEWLDAAKIYEKTLELKQTNASSDAKFCEKIGHCYNLASRQAKDPQEFRNLRKRAVEVYEKASTLFEKEGKAGESAHCKALASYAYSWLASDASEKRSKLDECITLGKKSLGEYENDGNKLGFAKMCNDLLLCFFERLFIASSWNEMVNTAQEGVDCANKAIEVLSKLENKNELLRFYFTASLQSWYAANVSEQEEKGKELVARCLSYAEKALELSKEIDNPYYAAVSNWAAAIGTLLFTEKVQASLIYAKEMLKQGTLVRDNYLMGVASYYVAFITNWMTLREADPDKKKEGYEKIIESSDNAIRHLELVAQDYFIAQTYLFYAESYSSLAHETETTPEKKRSMHEKAVEIGRKGLEHATRSGSPDAKGSALHALSKALHFYSSLEPRKEEKRRLLQEALVHRQNLTKIGEETFPANDWIRGVGKNYEGLIKVDLAKMETDENKKRAFLESAVLDMEEGVSRVKRWILSRPAPTLIAAVGTFEDGFGGILTELYLLNKDEKFLRRAIDVYEKAAQEFKKINLPSRVAESYWKIARNYDRVGKHLKAAESFSHAFEEYKTAAQKIPHFAEFYLDYAVYMNAWSEIERAKIAHDHEEYAAATKHYERTATLLRPLKSWSYMTSNFLALSSLEQAEDLSRKEDNAQAKEVFKRTADLFQEAKQAFEREIDKIQILDEKEKAVELSKVSMRRRDYCLARINVEEARICDRKGDYAESAEEYDSAADAFEKIIETIEAESDRKEMKPIAVMCRAWEKMKLADGRNSPELYHEASELFLKVKEHSAKDKTTLLALGNSAFCKALEFGAKFEASGDKDDFSKAKQFLESAAGYYLKAGFENASLWTGATEILFDAYNYMDSAVVETDPEKKMKTYVLAEKCFERSAKLYETAGYIGRRDEVLKTLKEVKEKREFALSLGGLLAAPTEASSTSIIYAPGLMAEEPVGLLKFERALVQANLTARQREVVVGEDFDLEVQVANLGKNAAFLIKVEDIVPEGFELVEKPEKYATGDGFLNLKRRKLAALETEEMKLLLKPRKKGKYVFRPKIQYIDETGEYRSCELEQVAVTVKEMGIRGWLKGPG